MEAFLYIFFSREGFFEKVLLVLADVIDCQLFPNEINGDCVSCWNATARK